MMTPSLWTTITIDGVEVPVFNGTSRTHHVDAWRAIDRALQMKFWMFGAIAFNLVRTCGGPQDSETDIQKFLKSVGIGRQTFQQVSKTYRVFVGTRTTGCTRYIDVLTFKHHEVAARLTDSPEEAVAALAKAHALRWSANRLQRSLESTRPKPKPPVILESLFERLTLIFCTLTPDTRRHVPRMLRHLSRHIEWTLSPDRGYLPPAIRDVVGPDGPGHDCELVEDGDDLPSFLRDLVADDSDPIGEHDMEASA